MSGMRVMVVTEHPVFREILTSLVAERGFEAHAAADGIDALRQIYHVLPQVIVSDAALPNLSGFELLPFVRRRFPEIGVIALWERRCTDARSAKEFADVILPVDPFNPQLLGDALKGMAADYPFRTPEEDAKDARQPGSELPENGEKFVCGKCERLQMVTSVARMNSLLSNVWRQLRPDDKEAERQNAVAELAFRHAFSELEHHQRNAHGVGKPLAGSEAGTEEQSQLHCANG